MTSGQRWVSIIALGALCLATASAVNMWLNRRNAEGGWFNYAPSEGTVFSPASDSPLRALGVWLIAAIVWLGASYLLFRRAPKHS